MRVTRVARRVVVKRVTRVTRARASRASHDSFSRVARNSWGVQEFARGRQGELGLQAPQGLVFIRYAKMTAVGFEPTPLRTGA